MDKGFKMKLQITLFTFYFCLFTFYFENFYFLLLYLAVIFNQNQIAVEDAAHDKEFFAVG